MSHPLLTAVMARALHGRNCGGDAPEHEPGGDGAMYWCDLIATYGVKDILPAIADVLEAALDVCRECGKARAYPGSPHERWQGHPFVPLVMP